MNNNDLKRIYYNNKEIVKIYKANEEIWRYNVKNEIFEFDNIEELKKADLKEETIVQTKGYYKEDDNGAAIYKIMSYDDWYNNILPKDILYIRKDNKFTKTPIDNYGNHVLNNGLVAIIQGDKYTPEQWGQLVMV